MEEHIAAWQQAIDQQDTAISERSKQLDRLAGWRLVTALAAFAIFLTALWTGSILLYLAAAAAGALFYACLLSFRKRRDEMQYAEALRLVYQRKIARADGGWRQFPDTGEDLLRRLESAADSGDPAARHQAHIARDLDVLGPDSVFQRLSAAVTPHGRSRLAALLLDTAPSREISERRQAAVRELDTKPGFRVHYEALDRGTRPELAADRAPGAEAFVRRAGNGSQPKSGPAAGLRRAYLLIQPVTTAALVLAALLRPDMAPLVTAAFAITSFQLFLAILRNGTVSRALDGLDGFNIYARKFTRMLEALEQETFSADILMGFQRELRNRDAGSASEALRGLERIGRRAQLRLNTMGWILMNMLFLWDERLLDSYRNWKSASGPRLGRWLEIASELEALNSLASAAETYPVSTYPVFTDEESAPGQDIRALHHPLIDRAKSVPNDADLPQGSYIITGSNMSGKTTYLRSLGLALLMAQAGSAIPAGSARVSPIPVYSSIRVDDDVSAGISSFYAEVLRIREMVDAGDSGRPLLLLIDEIFRGTNSADRVTGATEAIRRLSRPWTLLLVSTHDFELCELEHDPAVRAENRHFSESYADDRILFDYKIKNGRSHTTNARYLLKMAGII